MTNISALLIEMICSIAHRRNGAAEYNARTKPGDGRTLENDLTRQLVSVVVRDSNVSAIEIILPAPLKLRLECTLVGRCIEIEIYKIPYPVAGRNAAGDLLQRKIHYLRAALQRSAVQITCITVCLH